ncbi:MAG TPA: ACP S-malonyltransferase [Anaerolineales bacterium]|nr:ACP S-malonyltransferase [Anaerolineales bacterium]HNA89750.1 ACP S-malonyltransferase [Anaerolineales bacterium]HNB34909.1 ACP S-malonyltransferase [Anaerolineales bacterium]
MKLDPKSTAFVFPGQGSQTVGMGKTLAAEYSDAKNLFEEANAILGFTLSTLMWDGPEAELNETVNTQPALFIHSIASFQTFSRLFPNFEPASVAGHSLGELSALTASGALSFADGLRLVRKRGELMKRAGELAPGGMAAILGVDIPTLDKVCAEASTDGEWVQVANDNCPGQVVISGAKTAVERAMAGAKAAGAKRALPLAVSIAAHSPLMATIQEEWNQAVDAVAMNAPKIPVIGNVHASALKTAEDARTDIKAQMQSRVRWTDSIKVMSEMGIKSFVEVGTGSVLGGLIKRIASDAVNYPLGNPQDFAALE